MTGAECLLETLIANRIEVCFMNPGTSEMHFVAALDRVPGPRGVLCLYEGVCSGAADGYARMSGGPAATLLHLGPGLANGLSNFHNARKAGSPIVSIVGEHSTGHLKYDAPLTSDIAAFARTVSSQIRTVESARSFGTAVSETIAAALGPPGQIATLIIPADFSWLEAGPAGVAVPRPRPCPPSPENVLNAARVLRSGHSALTLGGASMNPRALEAAGRLAGATGVRVFADRSTPRLAVGREHFPVPKVPYFPEDAIAALAGLSHLILVEAPTPVSFFGYPDTPSSPVPQSCAVCVLATREQDGTAALEALVEECGARKTAVPAIAQEPTAAPTDGPLTLDAIGRVLAALLPENVIISEEMISSGATILPHLARAACHEQLPITGGSIGQGLPVAVGAAIACPDRKVLALQADGSAMYTLQALWTMARENLDVLIVVLANRRYRILDIEMARAGASRVGKKANDMLDLGRPDLDFISLSRGMGVPATRATTAAEFTEQFHIAVAERGPRLIEAVL
jgi:acetolactate synthase I/II/III large subunit